MVVAAPHLRADAQRNLERILEAARETFAEQGLEASVADIAQRAGVGTATIFRRFPTKPSLVAAIVAGELTTMLTLARTAAESADPGQALAEFMGHTAGTLIENRCLCEATGETLLELPRLRELMSEVMSTVSLLLARAQETGSIRADVVAEDIGVLVNAVAHAGLTLERTAPGTWRRYLMIVIDGLRPEGAHTLDDRPPSPEQLQAAKVARRRSVAVLE